MGTHPGQSGLISLPAQLSSTQFLEQLSDEEFWHLAAAAVRPDSMPQNISSRYLLCKLGQKRCIFPMTYLREIVSPPFQITLFPSIPAWMPGITAWRGETIAVIDLGAYLMHSTPLTTYNEGIVLIAQTENLILGLLVSTAETISSIENERIMPAEQASAWYSPLCADAVTGIYDEDALVLDIAVVLKDAAHYIML